jgi:DNA repair protein RecN (Recombination protein N)
VTLQALKQAGDLLVDVHGPHDHQSLLSTERQLEALDAYGQLAEVRAICGEKFAIVQRRQAEHDALQMSEKERQQKLERLQHQVKEIGGAKLKAGEDEQVERDYKVATHAQQLLELAETITQRLNEAEGAVLPQLAQVERALAQWEKLDPAIRESANLNRGAVAQIQELVGAVQAAAERIDLDAGQLRELEERLNLIQALKRKYGPTLDEVIASGAESEKELLALEASDETRVLKARELEQARKDLAGAAQKLSTARKKVAQPLSEKIQRELRGLGFKQASFQVELAGLEQAGRTGSDRIEFVFAPNPGEAPRPLRAIASSGEMARVMLAVKTTLAEVDEVPILIFDEVDANVGGETATKVGERLRSLGQHHQVLCITHLPQVAAQGEVHFRVEKRLKGGRTLTELTSLEGIERVEEIGRMLGGTSKDALALAQSLLKA